jgi:hypothetical protein
LTFAILHQLNAIARRREACGVTDKAKAGAAFEAPAAESKTNSRALPDMAAQTQPIPSGELATPSEQARPLPDLR